MERHYSDHGRPDKHSPIHDHEIDWSRNHPDLSSPINYFDGDIPEFKSYQGEMNMSDNKIIYKEDHRTLEERLEDNRFKTIDEMQHSIMYAAEIYIEYNGRDYFIDREIIDQKLFYYIFEIYEDDTVSEDVYYDTVDKLLDHELDGHKLRELATELIVWERQI